jgi:hypothetical protein
MAIFHLLAVAGVLYVTARWADRSCGLPALRWLAALARDLVPLAAASAIRPGWRA